MWEAIQGTPLWHWFAWAALSSPLIMMAVVLFKHNRYYWKQSQDEAQ